MSMRCINGLVDGNAHDFDVPMGAGTDMEPLLFCRRCGEVRRLEVSPPDDGPPMPPTSQQPHRSHRDSNFE